MHSHGLIRVPQYLEGIAKRTIKLGVEPTVLGRSAAAVTLDGGGGFGIVLAGRAMQSAIELAGSAGIGIASMRDCGHSGRIGNHTTRAARAGMIGMMMVSGGGAGQWVAPHGGREGRFATNPLSICVPGEQGRDLLVDLSTSGTAEGKVRSYLLAGRSVPPGWLIRADGSPSTDPKDLYGPPQGALLPFGGHKGFALAMAVEALAGGLSGAGCCTRPAAEKASGGDGVLAIAIRVDAFSPLADFAREIAGLLSYVGSAKPIPGQEVVMPGDPERSALARSAREGIELGEPLWKALAQAAQSVGVAWDRSVQGASTA